jgi:nitrile hydratase
MGGPVTAGERTGLLNRPAPPGRNPLHDRVTAGRRSGADRCVEPSTVRQLAGCPPTPAAGADDACVMVVVDTLADEVDAYGPMTLAEAVLDMRLLRAELDADAAAFRGVAIRILALRAGRGRRLTTVARVNDVGGQSGFGPVQVEPDEPPFHADWEARVYALNVAMLRRRVYNLDQFRDAIERMPPADYLAASYYERWLVAVETLTASRNDG